jgi:hypothetical protein
VEKEKVIATKIVIALAVWSVQKIKVATVKNSACQRVRAATISRITIAAVIAKIVTATTTAVAMAMAMAMAVAVAVAVATIMITAMAMAAVAAI